MSNDTRPAMGTSGDPDGTKTIGPSSMSAAAGAAAAHRLPANIGHYRILGLLGEGGMGIVYEAEQEQPRRVVALKVIKPGVTSLELLRRFEQESQALGRLQHPGIAQIYEAGTEDTGFGPQPYFAMELIRGRSLLQYAEAHHLSTRQRLELMAKVAEAVHHAHQRGLIHRDLKPGNILVDDTGQPKILDFGVARATDSDAQATRHTDLGQLVGTLSYMSPEQVLADPLELDTRSDVYALGVILYQLLAGRLPYTISQKLHEAVQTIREEDPTPLSSISRNYRGDIETIVAKALEKDKARRYASAAELAGDIRHYLEDEPIVAMPPSAAYNLQKFARRHKALVTGVAAVFVVLVAGIAASSWQAMRASRASQAALLERDRATKAERTATRERDRALTAERAANEERNLAVVAKRQADEQRNLAVAEKQRADTEAATAAAVNEFLQKDLLAQAGASTQASPNAKPDPDLKVRTALDRAAARIAGKFDTQPQVEASIRHTIATAYKDLGLFPEAQRNEERALELRRRALGETHRDTVLSMNDLGLIFLEQAQYGRAEPLFAKALEISRRLHGEQDADTLSAMNNLASIYHKQGKHAQAEPLYARALEVDRRILGEDHAETLHTTNNLAVLYMDEGKYAQAEPLMARLLEAFPRVFGAEHPDTLTMMDHVAQLYELQGKYPQTEQLYTKVLEVRRRILGEEHPSTLDALNSLAALYFRQGKYAAAEPIFVKVLDARRRVLGEENLQTLDTMNNVAIIYYVQGQYARAEPILLKVLDLRRRLLGEQHPVTLAMMNTVAVVYRSQAKYTQAEPLIGKVLDTRRKLLGEEHPDTLTSMYSLALLYQLEGKYAQAGPLYTKALEGRRRVLGPQHPDTTLTLTALGRLRVQQQKYVDAEPLLRESMNSYEKTSPDGWQRYNSQSMLGASLTGQQKYAEAEPLLVSAYQGLIERTAAIPADSRSASKETGERIVQLYQDWGKPEKADEWRQKLQRNNAAGIPPKP
jgi:eukaryotic-like serine/threonine-protein kinase